MLNYLRRMMSYRRLREMRESETESPMNKWRGIISVLIILVNEAMQAAASKGLVYNMVIYLMMDYHITSTKAANIVSIWVAVTGLVASFLGAHLADSYLGRYRTIGIASWASLLGMFLLWITAQIRESELIHCTPSSQSCTPPTVAELVSLFTSFSLISIGAGGVSCSMAFGADQVDRGKNSERKRVLERYFMFYYAISSLAVIIAFTATAYILDEYGWKAGFGVSTLTIFIFLNIFLVCSPLYFKEKPKKGLSIGIVQVIVATYKKRNLPFPDPNTAECYLPSKDSKVVMPSNNLRFLNKACMITNPEQDVAPDGSAVYPWRLCTIEQVEGFKALLRVLLIWSAGIMLWVNASQPTFKLLQANAMDRYISQKIEIPRAAFPVVGVSTMLIWGIIYDRAILPLASKTKGEPVQLSVKIRMGIGLLLSWMAIIASAIIESIRQRKAMQKGKMSAMWLVPQYCLHGLGEGFGAAGQTEFYSTELPKSMRSIAVTLLVQQMTVANWLFGQVLKVVSDLAETGGKEMISNDMSKAPLGSFYWVLALMSFGNLIYYLICSWIYGPCVEKQEENGTELDDM